MYFGDGHALRRSGQMIPRPTKADRRAPSRLVGRATTGNSSARARRSTPSLGNRLTELTVQRRERSSLVPVGGLGPLADPIGPGDWYERDRLAMNASGPSLGNRFVQAARYNTIHNATDHYPDISQRNDYYKALDFLLRHDSSFAGTGLARQIRFFGAAAEVTGYTGIGGLELAEGGLGVVSGLFPGMPIVTEAMLGEVIRLIHAVNARLFRVNMEVLSRVAASQDVVDPRRRLGPPPDAFHFDLRMVETEQGEVEAMLLATPVSTTSRTILNGMVNMNIQHGGRDPRYMAWAKRVYGVAALDFFLQEHRMAIGRAMVFIAHGRSWADFEAFITSGAREYPDTPSRPPGP